MRRASFPIAILAVVGALAGCGGSGEGGADTAAATGAGSTSQPRGNLVVGRDAFIIGTEPRCGECHTLADAGTSSKVASNLDEARPTFDEVVAAMDDGPGAMPRYGDVSPDVKKSIAAYVEFATHDGG
jgi:cytochrome c6